MMKILSYEVSTSRGQGQSFAEWDGVLGDDVLATAIRDRLLHHCDVLSINGHSYRLKDRMQPVAGTGDAMPWSPAETNTSSYPNRRVRPYPDTVDYQKPTGL